MLTPLLASHARGQPSTTLADAVALAPLVDAAATVPGNAWEETLRRYFRGAAAAMETPPEGATFRAASDASEVVCKWIVTGGPTALATAPDGGQSTAPTPAAAAAMAATLESVPRPYCALSARADAEAMAACEIELYAAGAESGSGEDDDVEQRRRRATELARAAATMPEVAAVRQSVRVLAHSDAFRHPALGRKAAREAGNAASSVPYYAATAAGAGASAAARAKFPRAVDYETIDARAAAGVYAVAELTVGAEAMVSVDAAECGELVRAAGAPDRSASHAVPSKIERACRKGAPEGACAGDGHVVIDGGQYTLFGAETAKLPKVAWDDGCVVCGGDVNAGVVLLCEGCDSEYHCGCLSPPLAAVPEGEWFCPACERARAADDDEARTPLDPRFAALEGTALRAVAAGAEGGGSTRARSEQARRGRELATRLTRRGGWSGLTPVERLETVLELTWHCLDCALVRAELEAGEKRAVEAREALRRHVRDWASYRKHGIPAAERDAIAAAARAEAEDKAEEAEAEAKAAKAAAKAAKEAAAKAEAVGADPAADVAADFAADFASTDGSPAKKEEEADAKEEEDAGDAKGGPTKSWHVRMAGIEAAKDAVAVVPEAEGRVRWQARWHELERALRAAEGRLEALGLDRDGAAYYLIAPWGEIAAQPSGASAGIGAELTFVGGGGAAAAAAGGKKRKRASKGGRRRRRHRRRRRRRRDDRRGGGARLGEDARRGRCR